MPKVSPQPTLPFAPPAKDCSGQAGYDCTTVRGISYQAGQESARIPGCLHKHKCYTANMFSFSHFFIGLIVAGLGVVFVKYNYQIVGLTGRQDWIESKLGAGSTYAVFKIGGVVIILGAFLYGTSLLDPVLRTVFAPLIDALTPGG
jgi:hypothetical protein